MAPRTVRLALLLYLSCLASCASSPPPRAAPPLPSPRAHARATDVIDVPVDPVSRLRERTLVSAGLLNPRGMHGLPDGSLLVAEAGTGDPADPMTGGLSRLVDRNGDGDYLDAGERTRLLDKQPSKNIVDIVRRDEVFGMAGMDEGGGAVLVALAFFGGPTTLYEVRDGGVRKWGTTHLNINDVAYDARRQKWYGVASTTDEVVRLLPGRGVERVVAIPPLDNGQDAVPGYLSSDPQSGALLVSLFTGSPEGEEGGEGIELMPRAGGIVRVDPDGRRFEWLVTGLTVPTDFALAPDGSIYVLEFCDAFVDPVSSREAMFASAGHGGFRRFSGRLLRIDRGSRQVSVVAQGLDAPSNLTLVGSTAYVAEGMGTPGRQIPGPDGTLIPLQGFIERIELE